MKIDSIIQEEVMAGLEEYLDAPCAGAIIESLSQLDVAIMFFLPSIIHEEPLEKTRDCSACPCGFRELHGSIAAVVCYSGGFCG